MKKTLASIVIPVFDEAENVGILHQEIAAAVKDRDEDYEILFVDDGSSDHSLVELKKIHASDPRVKIIHFRKNFGQSAAISAGFKYSSGEVVVAMDADLQNDPADIPLLVDKVGEGFDIVNGWRRDRHDKWLTRKVPSFFGNKLISWITGIKLHDYGCTLRGFRSDVVKNMKLYGEMHRYIPAIASRMGIKSTEILVNHRARKFGKSKYGLGRTFRVVIDLISLKFLLAYSHRPLQIFGGVGLLMILTGMGSGLYLTYAKFVLNQGIAGRPLLFFTLLTVFLGFQAISLGLLAEMLSRIYHEGLDKNEYSIRELIGFENENIDDRPRTIF
ncbi:MAG: glycosyltransferase family 2 protein [Candidatus Aminicenantes bacterium]|nr:glycosyltransferase family 2 protein [Acidobacteriota bacterium]MCG2810812.1 glycosyltransferase family 2 protein [Candidatus Aminicenantes bacterium]